jgi:hypothetical protein
MKPTLPVFRGHGIPRPGGCSGLPDRPGPPVCGIDRNAAPSRGVGIGGPHGYHRSKAMGLPSCTSAEPMTDTPPDHLASNPRSPFYDEAALSRSVGVRFNGVEKTNVDEYCVSEGWVRLTVGSGVKRDGSPMTIKLQGTVEPYFRESPPIP